MRIPKAGIFDVAGHVLSDAEKRFYADLNPLGFILFARNCESPEQVRSLVADLKSLLGRDDVLILIDQEGGRVARLKAPHWRKAPPAGLFSDIAATSISEGRSAVYSNARLIARDLHALGINVNCVPLADVPVLGAHDVIGDRAFGEDPQQVSILADAMAKGMLDGGVLPVLKHIPGHGRANVDSHESLPVVNATLPTLRMTDFVPFKALNTIPLGMTAHVLYTAIDKQLPATLSPAVIKLIREEIGFDGLLMSDDLSMKALKGSLSDLTMQTLAAGCDVALYCNIPLEQAAEAATVLAPLGDKAQERFAHAIAMFKTPAAFDYAEAEQFVANLTVRNAPRASNA
jgi:beta-N-acetylhexosaminidase